MFVPFFLFQSNLYIVLTHEKGPKNSIQDEKNPKQKPHRPPAAFYMPYSAWIGLQPNSFSQIFSKMPYPQNFQLIPCWSSVCIVDYEQVIASREYMSIICNYNTYATRIYVFSTI